MYKNGRLKGFYCQWLCCLLLLLSESLYSATQTKVSQIVYPASGANADIERSMQLGSMSQSEAQLKLITQAQPKWFKSQQALYQKLSEWFKTGGNIAELSKLGIQLIPASQQNKTAQFLMTSYFSPILLAKRLPDNTYRYPIYSRPTTRPLPSREQIYAGALVGKHLAIAYTQSLIDNFFLSIQGSGYLYLCDEHKQILLSYAGNNGYPYRSLGTILIRAGKMSAKEISMQSLKAWLEKLNEVELKQWLSQNPTFIFYQEQSVNRVSGAYGVPLLPQVAIATDPKLIPAGSVLLVEYPLLDKQGLFTGEYTFMIAFALDKGRAITGNHIDIYQGIGQHAGDKAGYYQHTGRIWQLELK